MDSGVSCFVLLFLLFSTGRGASCFVLLLFLFSTGLGASCPAVSSMVSATSSSDLRAGVVLVMVDDQGSETVCIICSQIRRTKPESHRIEKVA